LVGSIFHMTRKIVSEMTYNVSMGTLNPTIPYHHSILRSMAKVVVHVKYHIQSIFAFKRSEVMAMKLYFHSSVCVI